MPYLLHEAHKNERAFVAAPFTGRPSPVQTPTSTPQSYTLARASPRGSLRVSVLSRLRHALSHTHLRSVSQPLPRRHSVPRLDLDIPSSPLDIPLPDSPSIVTQPSTTALDTDSLPGITLQSLSGLSPHVLEASAPPHPPLLFQPSASIDNASVEPFSVDDTIQRHPVYEFVDPADLTLSPSPFLSDDALVSSRRTSFAPASPSWLSRNIQDIKPPPPHHEPSNLSHLDPYTTPSTRRRQSLPSNRPGTPLLRKVRSQKNTYSVVLHLMIFLILRSRQRLDQNTLQVSLRQPSLQLKVFSPASVPSPVYFVNDPHDLVQVANRHTPSSTLLSGPPVTGDPIVAYPSRTISGSSSAHSASNPEFTSR